LANVGITAQVLALIEPIHGARGGGPKGKRNGMYKHGRFTAEAVADRATLSALLRQSRATAQAVEEASIDLARPQPLATYAPACRDLLDCDKAPSAKAKA
jgi:hypothetical protein